MVVVLTKKLHFLDQEIHYPNLPEIKLNKHVRLCSDIVLNHPIVR